jgi:hypothetical protein
MGFKFILIQKVIKDCWLDKTALQVFQYTIRQNNVDYFIKYTIHGSLIIIKLYFLMTFIILPRFHSLKLISGHQYAGKNTLEQIVLNTSERKCSTGKRHILSEITVPK